MTVDISDEIKSIISKKLNVPIEQLTPDRKVGDLGAESLDIIEIVFSLEERFEIDIPLRAQEATRLGSGEDKSDDSESENLVMLTIGGIIEAVKERVDAKAKT
jgi:acyl carrier protein